MRVWHGWAILLMAGIGVALYARGLVDGLEMAGHADIVGWSWWKLVAMLTVTFVGTVDWSVLDLRKRPEQKRQP